ncbi:MAG: T9SS type A sorting domain-containing protein [Ignavibacteria bacterium]|nr:T9SS type A sorting domain-containing protein [Ignavibacteria bacterium]
MKLITTTFILFLNTLLLNNCIFSQYANFRLFPSGFNQIEPSISIHPSNPQILFASAYTISGGTRSEGIYVTTNGGLNWTGTDVCNGTPTQNHGGDPGPIIDKNGIFILTHLGGIQTGMFSNFSTDNGTNWSPNKQILIGDVDKGSPGTDAVNSSAYYGRTYLVWTYFVPPYRIVLSYTTNSGADWSPIINVNNGTGSNRSYGPSVIVSPNGTVYSTWASTIPSSPFTEVFIGFSKSTNGGVNWTANETAIPCNGIRTTGLAPWTIRANSFPTIDVDRTGGPRHGWIYIAVCDKNIAPAGSDPDIVLHRSTDEGNSWSAGVRVNNDPINNGRNQFFPALRVDENGGVNIIYYDNRNSIDSVDVYLSRSDNGGASFSDYRVTDTRFKPISVSGAGGGNMGDNLGITSGNGNLYPVWMSNVSGIFQTWSAIIDYTTIGIQQIGNELPKEYSLKQNYPNPFNPETKIEFSIPQSAHTVIRVFDITGKLISTLSEQDLPAGTFSVTWNAVDMPSGVYLYMLESGSFRSSKKMILLK